MMAFIGRGGGMRMDWRLWLAACACELLAAPANATQAEDAPGETIVVVGERVGRTVRETPSSLVVFTDTMLDATPGAGGCDGRSIAAVKSATAADWTCWGGAQAVAARAETPVSRVVRRRWRRMGGRLRMKGILPPHPKR